MTHSICRKTKIHSMVKHQINPFNKRYQYANALINTHITKGGNGEIRFFLETVLSSILGIWATILPLHPPPNTSCDPPHTALTPAKLTSASINRLNVKKKRRRRIRSKKLYNLLMVVKVNRVLDSSSSSSRKDADVDWLERALPEAVS